MTDNTENTPRIWTCPEHEIEYGPDRIGERGHRMDWHCPACDREYRRAERDIQAAHQRYEHWKHSSGIPSRYWCAVPASIQPLSPSAKSLRAAVQAYCSDIRGRYEAGAGMVLIGPPGLGKTLALAAIINEACKVYRGPVYVTWPDALASLKAGIGGAKGDPRREAVDSLRDAPFLALDEVAGVRDASDFDHSELFGLVDYRYREELPTLVAANATAAQFPGMVGERIADRLRETGPQLVLTGESQRGKAVLDGGPAFEEPESTVKVRIHTQGAWRERTITMRDGRLAA